MVHKNGTPWRKFNFCLYNLSLLLVGLCFGDEETSKCKAKQLKKVQKRERVKRKKNIIISPHDHEDSHPRHHHRHVYCDCGSSSGYERTWVKSDSESSKTSSNSPSRSRLSLYRSRNHKTWCFLNRIMQSRRWGINFVVKPAVCLEREVFYDVNTESFAVSIHYFIFALI